MTSKGKGIVAVVVKTEMEGGRALMCKVGELKVTPWHPIVDPSTQGTSSPRWVFPAFISEPEWMECGAVYSVMLQKSDNADHPDNHNISISAVQCVTLGHGITSASSSDDARAHAFLGDYEAVLRSVSMLPEFETETGVVQSGGVVKDNVTGLATGFVPPLEQQVDKSDTGVSPWIAIKGLAVVVA
jgi:hypothetical protein